MSVPPFSNEPSQDPMGATVDEPSASPSRTRANGPSAELAFGFDPVAATVANPGRTADYTPGQTTDYDLASEEARRAPSTARPMDTRRSGGSHRAPDLPETVAGYEILDVLGRGGMGVVYKALQPGLKRVVALKMILAGAHAGQRELARFRSEAEAVAQLQHVNIVQIYEVGEDAGQPYFSLEYIDGVSLAKKCDGAPLPPREAAELLLQLARGMDYAHQKGIVHRDLKPANILITTDGIAKITDFGLAKKLEEESARTNMGTVLGTPSYMPPEQAEGRIDDIGPHSDVYSLGAVLYDLLTGRPPFRGTTMLDTLQMVQTREPVAPSELQPKMPRDLQTICLKCLQKDPQRRYASAAALAEDLRRFLNGEPILARPAGIGERLWRWCRRNPRVAGLSAAIVFLLVIWASTSSALYSVAVRNEQKAEENEQRAISEAARADADAKVARTQGARAFEKLVALGGAFQKRLRSRRLSEKLGAEAQQLRQQLMGVLRMQMLQLARDLETTRISSSSTVALCQQLGDLLLRLGQGKEALRQYEEGCRIIRKVVDEQPDSDLARGNLGIMLMRLGDIALNVNGHAKAAGDYYRQGGDLQHEISVRPRSSDFSAEKNTILLSHHALRLGCAELRMGHPIEAAKHFEDARKRRKEWDEAASGKKPRSGESRSYLAQAYLWLATAAWHRGDAKACEEYFRECLSIYEVLLKEFPKDFSYKADMADILQARGDAQWHLGQPDEAAASYQRARQNLDIVLSHDPDDPSPQPLSALLHERLGADAQRRGQRAEAQKHYEKASAIRQDLVMVEPENRVWQAAYLLALARCGKYAEASRGIEKLQPQAAKSSELLLQIARCHAIRASAAEQKQSHIAKALEALQTLTTLDYRDVVLLRTDTDLASLREEPAFRALLERLQK